MRAQLLHPVLVGALYAGVSNGTVSSSVANNRSHGKHPHRHLRILYLLPPPNLLAPDRVRRGGGGTLKGGG